MFTPLTLLLILILPHPIVSPDQRQCEGRVRDPAVQQLGARHQGQVRPRLRGRRAARHRHRGHALLQASVGPLF